MKLHLGCDVNHLDGWHNVDVNPDVHPDEVADLTDPWPWGDESVEAILAEHVFEHLNEPGHAFDEAARVLVDGGTLEIAVPIGADAQADPTHRTTWTWRTPEFFAENDRRNWSFDTGLSLVDRELSIWFHDPFYRFNRLADCLASRFPVAACQLPVSSGELRAVYRRDR